MDTSSGEASAQPAFCGGRQGELISLYPEKQQLSSRHLFNIVQCSFYNTKSQSGLSVKEMEPNAYVLLWSSHSFNNCILSAYCVPCIVLCARNTTATILDTLIPLKEFTVK